MPPAPISPLEREDAVRISIFSPPWGGDAVGRGGGARAAPDGVPPPPRPPAPPLSLRDLSPRWGEKIPNAALSNLSGKMPRLPIFSPPWGGDAVRQRGGVRAAPDGVPPPPAPARPPSVAARPLPPLGGENPERRAPKLERGDAAGSPFSPPLGGEMPLGRGGVRAQRRTVCLPPPAPARPPLSRCDISPRRGEKIPKLCLHTCGGDAAGPQCSPPLRGSCRRQRGGTRAAPAGVPTPLGR